MRSKLVLLTATVAMLVAVALGGCVPDPPAREPDAARPLPTEEPPLFGDNEAAVAAVTEAYGRYRAMVSTIGMEAGADPERLKPFVTEKQWPIELASIEQVNANGVRLSAPITFDTVKFQQQRRVNGITSVTVYVCLDTSKSGLLDSTGTDVTPPHDNRLPMVVTMSTADEPANLKLEESKPWSHDFCG